MPTDTEPSGPTVPVSHAPTGRDEQKHLPIHEVTAAEVRKVRDRLQEANPDMGLTTDDVVRLTFMLAGRLSEEGALEDSGLGEQELEVLGTFAEAVEQYADPAALAAADRAEAPDGGEAQE